MDSQLWAEWWDSVSVDLSLARGILQRLSFHARAKNGARAKFSAAAGARHRFARKTGLQRARNSI
jgi:hypothetical protein